MRMGITMEHIYGGRVDLPISYNYLVQASLYNRISPELSNFLHDQGFRVGKRVFKLFTFSRLMGKYTFNRGRILYDGEITLYVSSPIQRFIRELANEILRLGQITIGENQLKVTGISFPVEPDIKNEVKIRMLSPLTIYSTLLTPDKRKKTYYYSPMEKEFSELIDANAKKKLILLKRRNLKSRLMITPIKVREVLVMYKNTVIKGWLGLFCLKGPKTLIKIVYDAGLGSKNSEGFGMFEVI
jgi:CRISPR-associated endoribonuclease Cas6